jgi:hypothetical protein
MEGPRGLCLARPSDWKQGKNVLNKIAWPFKIRYACYNMLIVCYFTKIAFHKKYKNNKYIVYTKDSSN